jgi:TIR domain
MPYVPGFDYDLFVSYASGDNYQGAVEDFVSALEKDISDNLVNFSSPQEKVRIYFDRERLATKTAVNWEEHLKAAASSSALLVSLLSPNYLSSEYCGKERDWFAAQSHVQNVYPFSVVSWIDIGKTSVPGEFKKAQRHPAGESYLAMLSADERTASAREFALKLRDALAEMRASLSAVFLGPAAGRGLDTRKRLRDELEKSGYRVVPDANYEYEDAEEVRALLKGSLLAIHFPGGGLDLDGLTIMKESFLSAAETLLVQPFGSILDEEEAGVLDEINAQLGSGGRFASVPYTRMNDKSDDQVWDTVKREVLAARFRRNKSEFSVGIACEARDLAGAKAVAGLIDRLGVRAQYPAFDTASSITERLQALRTTITQSQALLCYWGEAEGKGLGKRLEQDARRRYEAKAWYLAPPFDVPGKEQLSQQSEMVLQQKSADVDQATLEPFLRELGWEPPK